MALIADTVTCLLFIYNPVVSIIIVIIASTDKSSVHSCHVSVVAEKPPRLEEWLAKRAQMRAEQELNEHQSSDKRTNNFHGIQLPTGLPPVHLLPPSVLPPLAGSNDNLPVVLWG